MCKMRLFNEPADSTRTLKTGESWTKEDDVLLMELSINGESNQYLATYFGRTEGAIVSRLDHLRDPKHQAYKRYHGKFQLSTYNKPK